MVSPAGASTSRPSRVNLMGCFVLLMASEAGAEPIIGYQRENRNCDRGNDGGSLPPGRSRRVPPLAAEAVERAHVDGVETFAHAEHEDAQHDEGDQDREGDRYQRHPFRAGRKPDAGSALLEVAEEAKQTCRVADQIPLRNAW